MDTLCHTRPCADVVPSTVPPLRLMVPATDLDQAVVCQGWLLKKRRKKMQGTQLESRQGSLDDLLCL